MKALMMNAHGGFDQLEMGSVPDPAPGPGRVRVRLKASALNRLDLFVLKGLPGSNLRFPHIPGADGLGVVDAVGPGVEGWDTGQRVVIQPGISCGTCAFCLAGQQPLCKTYGILGEHLPGTFAEVVVVPAVNLAAAPGHLTDAEGAALPLTFLTAYRMLFTRAELKAGETLLIHGAGSGVSLASLRMAVAAGARVVVTSGSDVKLEKARALGAAAGFNYRKEKVDKAMRDWTRGEGVDVVMDTVGEATWAMSLKCVRKGGRIVTCGATSGPNPVEEIRLIFWKQLSILGSTMGGASDFARMLAFVSGSTIRPVVDEIFPLREARHAYERLERGEQFGKIVLDHATL